MRATAILCVVVAHVLWIFPEAKGPLVSLLHLAGVTGVEIFFVLSGFLIGRILYRIITAENGTRGHLGYFLVRRWFRTLPNYYLVLLINIAIVLYIGRELPDTLVLYFLFLQNLTFGMDIFFTESWSLPIEEVAYVIGPALLYIGILLPGRPSRKKIFLWVTLLIIAFFMFTKLVYQSTVETNSPEIWNINLKAVVLYRVDAIYTGVLAAYLSINYPNEWARRKFQMVFLGMILFFLLQFLVSAVHLSYAGHPFFWSVLYLPLGSLAIALFLPVLSQWRQPPSRIVKTITFISVVSYGMYLLHYSIILQLMRYFFPIENLSFVEKLAYSLAYLVGTVGLAYVLYIVYEKPVMDIRDRKRIKQLFSKKPH
jgi:peptidoglycan/LPS O-acetylase OafA/YrhL